MGIKNLLASGAAKTASGASGGLAAVASGGKAASWAAFVGMEKVVGAFDDPGFVIFIVGLAFKILSETFNIFSTVNVTIAFATGMLLISGLTLFRGRGFPAILAFWLWYVPLKQNFYFGMVLLITLLLFHILIVRDNLNNFFREEVGPAVLLVVLFFLEIGGVAAIVNAINSVIYESFSLTAWSEMLIRFMPWFAFLGLMRTEKKNALINIAKIAGVFYVIIIFIFPLIPEVGVEGVLPGAEEIAREAQTIREGGEGENPFISHMVCTWEMLSNPGGRLNLQQCIEERQARTKCEDKFPDDEERRKECVDKILNPEKAAGGSIDAKQIPTEISIKRGDDFQNIVYLKEEGTIAEWPIIFEVKNPKQEMNVELNCYLKDSKEEQIIIPGTLDFQDVYKTTISDEEESVSHYLFCRPKNIDELEEGKKYNLVVEALMYDLKTSALLKRIIGSEVSKEDEEFYKEYYFPNKNHQSSSPADLTILNFWLGERPSDILLEKGESIKLSAGIENRGGGELLNVKDVSFRMPEGVRVMGGRCPYELVTEEGEKRLIQKKVSIEEDQETKRLGVCSLNIDSSLFPEEDVALISFVGEMSYDYKKKMEAIITVR